MEKGGLRIVVRLGRGEGDEEGQRSFSRGREANQGEGSRSFEEMIARACSASRVASRSSAVGPPAFASLSSPSAIVAALAASFSAATRRSRSPSSALPILLAARLASSSWICSSAFFRLRQRGRAALSS